MGRCCQKRKEVLHQKGKADIPAAREPETRQVTVSDRETAPAFRMNHDHGVTSGCNDGIRDLLEDLQREADLAYISDIPYAANENQVIGAIERLPAEDYPAGQWKEALVYILKRKD